MFSKMSPWSVEINNKIDTSSRICEYCAIDVSTIEEKVIDGKEMGDEGDLESTMRIGRNVER